VRAVARCCGCLRATASELDRSLEEILVTATRVETSLQQTPISVYALTGEQLEIGGIDTGRELGIMVPNVVLNPGGVGDRARRTNASVTSAEALDDAELRFGRRAIFEKLSSGDRRL
jgi:outer membrane receptor protein involved in Fe transport